MGSITLTKFTPVNTFCEFAESITRWKCAKRKCKTFQLLQHRVIEQTVPGDTTPKAQAIRAVIAVGNYATNLACLHFDRAARASNLAQKIRAATRLFAFSILA
jgi:hypothetical protein